MGSAEAAQDAGAGNPSVYVGAGKVDKYVTDSSGVALIVNLKSPVIQITPDPIDPGRKYYFNVVAKARFADGLHKDIYTMASTV